MVSHRILRRMNEAGGTYYLTPDIADALGLPLEEVSDRMAGLEASGHVGHFPNTEPRGYALTYLGMEAATTP